MVVIDECCPGDAPDERGAHDHGAHEP